MLNILKKEEKKELNKITKSFIMNAIIDNETHFASQIQESRMKNVTFSENEVLQDIIFSDCVLEYCTFYNIRNVLFTNCTFYNCKLPKGELNYFSNCKFCKKDKGEK